MVFDIPIVSDLLFYPLKRDAEKVYSLTSGVIGTSDEYRDRPFLNQKRDVLKETVYVGNEISVFDREAEQHADEVQKEEGTFWVTYAGTIGTSYDIRTMVLAAEELMKQGKTKIRFQILGDGPTREMLENLAKERKIQNVKFTGYVPYEQMAAYLVKSDVLINSFVRKAPQSIVTKIGDYLAAGKPMINTCMSPEFRKKVEQDGFGINIEPEDVRELVNAVEWMYENEAERNDMGNRARKIAEEQFDRPVSYGKIEAMISSLITKRSKGRIKMRPVFSVVMPTYGVEKYIEKAIRSVQAQTFENWELLVIDDCTCDQKCRNCLRNCKNRFSYPHRTSRNKPGA